MIDAESTPQAQTARGRLKVFLGYASRTGKTRRMLDELERRKDRGQDVAVAWVQDDEDAAVRRLLLQLPVIPPLMVHGLPTVDVDGIIARHPSVCAIDGLAHSNPAGARHAARWQDIEAVLAAGISVVTAVNVHFVEGLQDEIDQLLGVRKAVSVPDDFLRQADEIVLVDLGESEVRQRLGASDQRPTDHQLSSLREMALRYAADTVDRRVEEYRLEHNIEAVWGTHERVLVCVSPHARATALVERGRRLAERLHAPLAVIYVTPDPEWSNVSVEERTVVQAALALARTYDARVEVIEAGDVASAILSFAQQFRATEIIVGHSRKRGLFKRFSRSVVGRVLRGVQGADVHISSDLPPPPSLSMEMPRVNLAQQRSGGDASRGRLKVYLGYAAGVGKTWQMLRDGRDLRDSGSDVVVGYIEPHGRIETMAQVEGLETVPRRAVSYRGRAFEEMDLAAVLERHPAVCLVDELAHTNVPGVENEKRWQDVEALRDAGISVMTTVNVQHLESLNDSIQRITGVRVRETVPDWVVSRADDVVLIDLTPRALLNRLKRGVVYPPEKALEALQNFFREGNLSALRELALRQTADVVESARQHEPLSSDAVLACIDGTNGPAIVRRAKRMADRLHARCYVVHVHAQTTWEEVPDESRNAVEQTFALARLLHADTMRIQGRDVAARLVTFAHAHHVTQIFVGQAVPRGWAELLGGSVVERVIQQAGDIDVHVVALR